jgi:mannose-6-phosphate isomerase
VRPEPFVLEPILKPKVWGGRRLAQFGKPLPEGDEPIGESWELADLASTSVDGGGGGGAHSVIASGTMAGRTVREVAIELGEALLGNARLTPDDGFPLLVKYLDARTNLSVQVHPSAAFANAHPGCHLKTESWYVVAAEPGAVIYAGVHDGVDRAAFRKAVEAGRVEDVLQHVPARVGEIHHLESGTVHALGAGVLVAEVQTPSDTTFRLHDWGRTGRTLHIAEALACATMGACDPPACARDGEPASIATPHYAMTERRLTPGEPLTIETGGHGPRVLMLVSTGARVEASGGEPVRAERGRTLLVPAACEGMRLTPEDDGVMLDITLGASV